MTLIVDPSVQYHAHRDLTGLPDDEAKRQINGALSYAFGTAYAAGRIPVQVEIIVRVAPRELDFESDAPLVGGVCDMTPGCESCQ